LEFLLYRWRDCVIISAQKSLPPQHAAVVGPADDHGPRAPVFNGAG
jgi:hypothetical protein